MLFEVEQAANRVRAEVDPDANIIFGNTILDDMEGRIRVSVVATGIDAESMRELPENIERLRPRAVAQMQVPRSEPKVAAAQVATVAAITRSSVNPVHRQVEALAEELNAAAPAMEDHEEQIVFEDEAMPEHQVMPEVAAINVAPQPLSRTEEVRVRAPQPKKQGLFGLFGRQRPKVDLRQEPAPTPVAQPRATSQVIARIQPEPASRPAVAPADDLFPEHKKDEQFEIPAFLRRQTN
jgi:cell division protein FtsZ